MRINRFSHPIGYNFLKSLGFVSNQTSTELPDLECLLETLLNSSDDCQLYILRPLLLEVLSDYYPFQDVQYALNEFIQACFPTCTVESDTRIRG